MEDSIASIDPSLFSPDDPNSTIKPEEMKVYLRMLEDSQVIDKRLAENTQLLRVLQEAQWHRLRKANTKASEMEIKSAERLLESLTSLANARPRTPELSDSSSPFLANPAIAASIVQTKPRAYYGTLDKSNSKGIPDYVMVNEDSKAKKEGSSLAPPEMNRKGSSQGQKKSKKNAASTNKKEKDKNQVINGTAGSPTGQISESTPQPAQVKQETPAA